MTAPPRPRPPSGPGTASGRPDDTVALPRVSGDGAAAGSAGAPGPPATETPGSRRSRPRRLIRSPRTGAVLVVACAVMAVAHVVLPPIPFGAATAVLVPVLVGTWTLAALALAVSTAVEYRREQRERYPRMRRRPRGRVRRRG